MFGLEFFDHRKAESELKIQPDSTGDDLRWKAKTRGPECIGVHHARLPTQVKLAIPSRKMTRPKDMRTLC
jgi:hypothetical protein